MIIASSRARTRPQQPSLLEQTLPSLATEGNCPNCPGPRVNVCRRCSKPNKGDADSPAATVAVAQSRSFKPRVIRGRQHVGGRMEDASLLQERVAVVIDQVMVEPRERPVVAKRIPPCRVIAATIVDPV